MDKGGATLKLLHDMTFQDVTRESRSQLKAAALYESHIPFCSVLTASHRAYPTLMTAVLSICPNLE